MHGELIFGVSLKDGKSSNELHPAPQYKAEGHKEGAKIGAREIPYKV